MTPFERAARDLIASRGAAGTRRLYTLDLDRWLAFCAERGIDPAQPTPSQSAAFRDQLAAVQKAQTVRRTLAALSRIYRAAMNAWPQAAKWNPFDADVLMRPPPSDFAKTEAITRDDAAAIIAQAAAEPTYGMRDAAILQMLYDTGLRVSSVASLRREKLFKRSGMHVARVRAKHKDEVDVELTAATVAAVQRWLAVAPASVYVFPSRKPTKHIARDAVYRRLRKYGDAARVPHAHPHRFRAAYITDALDAGERLEDVQAAVHHTTPQMTQRYDRGKRGRGVAAAVAAARSTGNASPTDEPPTEKPLDPPFAAHPKPGIFRAENQRKPLPPLPRKP